MSPIRLRSSQISVSSRMTHSGTNRHNPQPNHLLAVLPREDRVRLFPKLELVHIPLGNALCEPGMPMHYVYFPTASLVSLLYVLEDGA